MADTNTNPSQPPRRSRSWIIWIVIFCVILLLMLLRDGASSHGHETINQYQFGEQISWTHRKHTIRTGFEAARIQQTANNYGSPVGNPTFQRWADLLLERPAVQLGRMVNRLSGEPSSQLHERHDASDFDTKTQDKLAAIR